MSIIGAGRLGTALGLALKGAGYKVEVVATKRASAARRAARAFGPGTLAITADKLGTMTPSQQARFDRCALILIATPDDVIASVAKHLAAISQAKPLRSRSDKNRLIGHRVVLHTSGALAAEVLKPMRRAGFAAGSLHPLVSISDSQTGAKLLAGAFFSVEGDAAAVRLGKSIVSHLGGESFKIDSGRKALYHAAALTASPHMTALFDIAVDMLGVCGVPPARAQRILLPLVESTLANLKSQDPARALTGTFARNDMATVQAHLAALEAANVPQALNAYVALGQRSVSMAKTRGANPTGLAKISRILARAVNRSRTR